MTSTHSVFQTERPISRVSVFISPGSRSSRVREGPERGVRLDLVHAALQAVDARDPASGSACRLGDRIRQRQQLLRHVPVAQRAFGVPRPQHVLARRQQVDVGHPGQPGRVVALEPDADAGDLGRELRRVVRAVAGPSGRPK